MARIWVVEFWSTGYGQRRPQGSSSLLAWGFRRRIDAFRECDSAALESPQKTKFRVSEYVRVERKKKGRK